MTISERMFKLRSIAPFNRLSDTELAVIAEAVVERQYEGGKRIASMDKPARALMITIQGSLTDHDGRQLPAVHSPEALLTGTPLPSDVYASRADGAVCFLINKSHFFTILYECPALAIGFIDMSAAGNNRSDKDITVS